ncbi:MAG: M23 family metallopeptidase [Firmicutes bacterium]|nr:M23 family metallopeptidase [Bacillota bacterium]
MFKWNRSPRPKAGPKEYPDDWASYYQTSAGWGKKSMAGQRRNRNNFFRIAAVLLILAVLFMVRQVSYPVGEQARENLRYLLTAEWNFQPLLDKSVQLAAQMVNWDNPLLHGTPGTALEPVTGQGLSRNVLTVPVPGRVVQQYGWVKSPVDGLERFHAGIDISAPLGETVTAAADGRVDKVAEDPALGKFILINHSAGSYTLYGGVTDISVAEGQEVRAGQTIALVGEGDTSGGGLHFEVRENGKLVDPLTRLDINAH